MAGRPIDLDTWERAEQFRFFKRFDRPHYATTARVDVTAVMAAKEAQGLSPFRAALYAIGAGVAAVPALRMTFDGENVTAYDSFALSPAIDVPSGEFRFAYIPWTRDRGAFDAAANANIDEVRAGGALEPNVQMDGMAVIYLSCLPWLDYTSLNNALQGPQDCVPRIGWGKITGDGSGASMPLTIEVHHALVDGRHVGAFFGATETALAGPWS
ncbi:MAG: CatA-like O-acetyltransferase [Pseudomonadota bacterium]